MKSFIAWRLGWIVIGCLCFILHAGNSTAQTAPGDAVAAFHALCTDRANAAEKDASMVVVGVQEWLFLDRELRHVGAGPFWGKAAASVSHASKPEYADPLPAILDFKAQLDRLGIELLLVPVPPKVVIYPDKLVKLPAGDLARRDPQHQDFYKLLGENGIAVLDLVPIFLAHRDDQELGSLYCRQDSHWSGGACIVAAREIAKRMQNRPWMNERSRLSLESRIAEVQMKGDLASALPPGDQQPESIRLRFVGVADGTKLRPQPEDVASPIVLMGDSHNLVFHAGGDMHAAGAGLADQLALELGLPMNIVAVRGSGATPARINLLRNARQSGYLASKKLVIWCFAAREFTESDGWRNVPFTK